MPLNSQIFYFSTIRKTVVAFGSLFTNLSVQRFNADGTVNQTLKVPLAYGPKLKWLLRIRQDPDFNLRHKVETSVPRMGFEITTLAYDASRKIAQTTKRAHQVSSSQMNSQYSPAPYNINFNLYILTKNQDDGLQILEQILPFFTPDYVVSINDIPQMGQTLSIPFSIQNCAYDEEYDGDYTQRTAIVWTLGFVSKMNLAGPIRNQGVIKEVIQNFYTNLPGLGSEHDTYDLKVEPTTAGPLDDYTLLASWNGGSPTATPSITGYVNTFVQYKGAVPTFADLPPNAQPGDLWVTLDTGYSWIFQ